MGLGCLDETKFTFHGILVSIEVEKPGGVRECVPRNSMDSRCVRFQKFGKIRFNKLKNYAETLGDVMDADLGRSVQMVSVAYEARIRFAGGLRRCSPVRWDLKCRQFQAS